MSGFNTRSAWRLTWWILGGLVAGAVLGEALYRAYGAAVPGAWLTGFELVGETVFMGLLRMVLVPLVASSVVVGVCSIGDPSRLGRLGIWTLVYYFSTMAAAAVLGAVLVTSVRPGDLGEEASARLRAQGEAAYTAQEGGNQEHIERSGEIGLWGAVENIVSQLVPSNPVAAAAGGQLLPVIVFSLLLGVVLAVVGPRGKPLVEVFEALFAAVMKLVEWILWLAPAGVLALVALTVARIGLGSLAGPSATASSSRPWSW